MVVNRLNGLVFPLLHICNSLCMRFNISPLHVCKNMKENFMLQKKYNSLILLVLVFLVLVDE